MDARTKKNQLEILKILRKSDKPMGSIRLAEELAAAGSDMKARNIRFHLGRLDELGFTEKISRRHGRVITEKGLAQLEQANVMSRLRFIVSKIDGFSYNMTFDLAKMTGSLVINFSLIPLEKISEAVPEIEAAFNANLGMGSLVMVKNPGEYIGNTRVPDNMLGLGTVCSVTLNGVLLKMGVPVVSRYGCLLRIENGKPASFTELVDYIGVTMDPLDLFIRANMTSVREAALTGNGLVGVSFREAPAAAAKAVETAQKKLEQVNLGGILAVGKPNRPLLNVPVNEGMIGIAVIGGINPVAAAHEVGVTTESKALHGLIEYSELKDFHELELLTKRK